MCWVPDDVCPRCQMSSSLLCCRYIRPPPTTPYDEYEAPNYITGSPAHLCQCIRPVDEWYRPTDGGARRKTGAGGKPAKSQAEDLELTTQVILDYIKSGADDEGVVDDDDDE